MTIPDGLAGELLALARRAAVEPVPMTCVPPAPDEPFAYGDIVPLGFLLRALKALRDAAGVAESIDALQSLLRGKQRKGLWAFHTGRLITSTDSSLVLLGMDDTDAVAALEMFFDGEHGYYPQLWSDTRRPDRMMATDATRHWCRADYATTCLVRAHRAGAGLDPRVPLEYLARGFNTRSGLYFANPYLTDWALALAVAGETDAEELRENLACQVAAGAHDDGSFGSFDPVLSTALAVLTLDALGRRSGAVSRARRWLAGVASGLRERDTATPFYSALAVGSGRRAISYYRDTSGMIRASLVACALVGEAGETGRDDAAPGPCHSRYRCASHEEYILRHCPDVGV